MLIEVMVMVVRSVIAAIALALLCCAAVHVIQRGNTAPIGSGPANQSEQDPTVPPGTTYYG